MTDQQIMDAFVAKYGATVLAAPTTKGFDLVAWVAPFAVFAAALLGTILLIRRWGGLGGKKRGGCDAVAGECRSGGPGAAGAHSPGDRRQRTDFDGGFSVMTETRA